ncbi:peptidylprolyl isomerase [Algoriphagus halophilus]|uniref:peptidylprolyl isomerase n=1 Tax=Algoriphagus halophilus TaxID=226505 RepID=A0A1N6D868_9BACT|nr:peptidylprolyl isomerase [Algoriphagus halophilus]SIN67011.1 peptidyl-prolyl cis-trans isomerase B (cyclophilin B) [Algoriphagus halophilus]
MKSPFVAFLALLLFSISACQSSRNTVKLSSEEKSKIKDFQSLIPKKDSLYHVLIATSKGDMMVKLYNETPVHRDNFIQKVKEGYYDSLEFHRVINDFMIQGGRPNPTPDGSPQPYSKELIPAEFRTDQHIYHRRGALAAARTNNPEKASSSTQFYIVQRKPYTLPQLEEHAEERELTLNDFQKELYTSIGGTPHLDGAYTVYGELENGFDVLDKIASTTTDEKDQPTTAIRMKMYLLNQPKQLK